MFGRLRPHLTYANVMVTILAFVVLGGTAWALSRNSVGSKQLKPNAVKESDIANDAVTGPKVRDSSLDEDDFADGTLLTGPAGPPGAAGADGQQGAPGQDATNNFAYIGDNGAANNAAIEYGNGVTAVNDPPAANNYTVTFARSVTNCAVLAVEAFGDPPGNGSVSVLTYPFVNMAAGSPQQVDITFTDHTGSTRDTSFLVTALC